MPDTKRVIDGFVILVEDSKGDDLILGRSTSDEHPLHVSRRKAEIAGAARAYVKNPRVVRARLEVFED